MIRAAIPLAALALAPPAGAALTERELARVGAHPPAGAILPAGLSFTDGRGGRTSLARVAGGRPLVLIFADFTCRHVCAPGLALAAGALLATRLAPGRDYRLAVVGLDPRDTPAAGRRLARGAVPAALLPATTVLTGDAATVRTAMRALGYRTAYDAASDQFAHDAATYVLARDGRLVAVLPELGLQPAALEAALAGAPPPRGGLVGHVARLCYGFAAAHGRFGRPALIAVQALSVLLLAGAAFLFLRRRAA